MLWRDFKQLQKYMQIIPIKQLEYNFKLALPWASDVSIHPFLLFHRSPRFLGVGKYFRGNLNRKDRNQAVKLPLIYYLSEQMSVLRPQPKPNRRMLIENDSLYSDSCLVKMTCEALNSLNGIDLNAEGVGVQFTASQEHPSPHEEASSHFPGGFQDFNIDHLLNLDSWEGKDRKVEHRKEVKEETPPRGSYIEEESSTLSYLRENEKERLQQGNQIIEASPSPLKQPAYEIKTNTKNIPCYISRFVSRTMLGRYQGYLKARCARAGVGWGEFRQFCDPSKFRGINSLVPFFTPGLDEVERRKKEIFTHLFQKILRRHYLRLVEGQGHMANRGLYIWFKNKQLLYCQSVFPS